MLGHRQPPDEVQALAVDAPCRGLPAQVLDRAIVAFEQHEHAAVHRAQDAHPAVERGRRDLVRVVEAAEHEPRRRKPQLLAREHLVCRRARGVVHLIARQVRDLFHVMLATLRRNDHGVGEEIVHVARAERAQVTEIARLHGRRPKREDARPGALREAAEVDGDVDLELACELRDVDVGALANVDEAVECGLEPRAHRALRIGGERECRDLEARAVVALEELRREVRQRMIVEIAGEVADADAVVTGTARNRPEVAAGRILDLHVDLRGAPLHRRRVREREHGERRRYRLAPRDPLQQAIDIARAVMPVAQGGPRDEIRAEEELRVGLEAQGAVVELRRLRRGDR